MSSYSSVVPSTRVWSDLVIVRTCATNSCDGAGEEAQPHRIQFNATRPDEYCENLRNYIFAEYKKLKPATFHEWHETVNDIQDAVCTPYQILLDRVLKAVHKQILLPAANICHCDNLRCRLNISSKLIYNENRPQWDVAFCEKDADFVLILNLARLTDDLVDRLKTFYIDCVKVYFDHYYHISKCCPISLQFVQDIDLLVRSAKETCCECLNYYYYYHSANDDNLCKEEEEEENDADYMQL